MYKIFILKRGGEDPLWTEYKVTEKVMIDDPSGKVDPETGEIIKVEVEIKKTFETDSLDELQVEYDKVDNELGQSLILPVGVLKVESNVIITP